MVHQEQLGGMRDTLAAEASSVPSHVPALVLTACWGHVWVQGTSSSQHWLPLGVAGSSHRLPVMRGEGLVGPKGFSICLLGPPCASLRKVFPDSCSFLEFRVFLQCFGMSVLP